MGRPTGSGELDTVCDSERRNPQAGALRQLFREQWSYLLFLLDAARARAAEAERDGAIVEDVVDGTDPRLRAVTGYRKRLRASARTTLEHVTRTVAALPRSLPIARERFSSDQRVNTLFASPRAIDDICGTSRRLQEFFASPAGASRDEAHFSLFAVQSEKTVLGVASSGSLLVRDVVQTNVSFDEHLVVAPAGTEAQARAGLEQHLFDNLVASLKVQMARIVVGNAPGEEPGAPPRRQRRRTLPPLSPQVYLEALTRLLDRPEEILRLRSERIMVSKLGVKLDADTDERANVIDLHELEIGARPPSVLALARFPRAEMLSALELSARERTLVASI